MDSESLIKKEKNKALKLVSYVAATCLRSVLFLKPCSGELFFSYAVSMAIFILRTLAGLCLFSSILDKI